MDLKGRVAIVTGGAQGIGKAISVLLLKTGMKVCICDIKEEPGESVTDLIEEFKENIAYQKCDVSSFEEYKNAFEKTVQAFGRIDLVANNAGMMNEERAWRRSIEVNFIGVVHGIKLGFQYMGVDKGGSGGWIINTGSSVTFEPNPLNPVYSGTKQAVGCLTRCYGSDLYFKKSGVKVGAVCPGATSTDLFKIWPDLTTNPEEGWKIFSDQNTVAPEEIARGVLKIMEDGVNGSLLRVDYEDGTRYG